MQETHSMLESVILIVLGAVSLVISMSSHERIQQMKRNPYAVQLAVPLKFERVLFGFFSVFFFFVSVVL